MNFDQFEFAQRMILNGGDTPTAMRLDKTTPIRHQVMHFLHTSKGMESSTSVAVELFGSPVFRQDMDVALGQMTKRGTLRRRRMASDGSERLSWHYELSPISARQAPAYVQFFTGQAKESELRRLVERERLRGTRDRRLARQRALRTRLVEEARLAQERQVEEARLAAHRWTSAAEAGDWYDDVRAAVANISPKVKDDVMSELVCYVLEGGDMSQLKVVAQRAQRDIFRGSSMSNFTVSLDETREWGDGDMPPLRDSLVYDQEEGRARVWRP